MARPLLLIHGYSADGLDFLPLKKKLREKGVAAELLNVGNYISLNNEITIRDIAEGLERAIELVPILDGAAEFDAIVHSTGMLVVRAWLAHQRAAADVNKRLQRLKHLVGVAPATWGSPQASKGRTWLGALVKGDKRPGPDFMNAGDKILDGLELGSKLTWDLAHMDLLGEKPYFGMGDDTPYVAVFIGNRPYEGVASVANDPGTDGTVRWAGCGLNTRKITLDLTRTPVGPNGQPADRVSITDWAAGERLDVPILAVADRNHGSLISDPDDGMVERIASFLNVDNGGAFTKWLDEAKTWAEPARQAMLIDPGDHAAGLAGSVKQYFGHLFHLSGKPLEGWQQFVLRARDEHGEPVTDYMLQVFRWETQKDPETGNDKFDWWPCDELCTDVHAYRSDPSFRCMHIRLPEGITGSTAPMQIRIQASTGTEVVTYQGYGTDVPPAAKVAPQPMRADSKPVIFDITGGLGTEKASLFHPFTTTLVEIVLNRVPYPFGDFSQIFYWIDEGGNKIPMSGRGVAGIEPTGPGSSGGTVTGG